jgi:hypothetical protein
MARPGRPARNRTARPFRRLRRFHHVINSDEVFGDDRNHCENGDRNPPPIQARRQNAVEPFEAGFLAITRGNIVFDLQNSRFQRIPLRRDVLLGAIGPEPQSRDECARIVKTRQAAASSPWVAFDSIE